MNKQQLMEEIYNSNEESEIRRNTEKLRALIEIERYERDVQEFESRIKREQSSKKMDYLRALGEFDRIKHLFTEIETEKISKDIKDELLKSEVKEPEVKG